MKMITLRNGLTIPDFCFGSPIVFPCNDSYRSMAKYMLKTAVKNRARLRRDIGFFQIVRKALENGCTMFDTSRAYGGSERVLGNALRRYERGRYQIVTKLCNADQFCSNVRGGFETSLKQLQMEYVDVYLMHWPVEGHFTESWKEMERLYEEGRCKAIGVCNFNIHHLEELSVHANIKPMVNQFECHPLFTQDKLREYCREQGIQVMAYTSTGRMDERMKKTALGPIAERHGKSMAQTILRWHQQIGNIPIVNTNKISHLLDNLAIDDFTLSEEEILLISECNINSRLRYDPDNCDFRQL